MRTEYQNVLGQIESGQAILFLGAGSTVQCRRTDGKPGLTGHGLAKEILHQLVEPTADFPIADNKIPTLMEAAEYFQSNHPGRRSRLDRFIQDRLRGLRPTLAHYLAASFPWKAIITTNYNTVAEDAWKEAANHHFAANEVLVVKTDDDLARYMGEFTKVRLFKPHGCVDLQMSPRDRMVLTSQDYAHSETLRKDMYQAIKSLARSSTTVFVGYSLGDYTFRNMYYRLLLDLGEWGHQSYAVTPAESPLLFQWKSNAMSELNTTLIDATFNSFMLNLVSTRGKLHDELKRRVRESWDDLLASEAKHLTGLQLRHFTRLPSGDQTAPAAVPIFNGIPNDASRNGAGNMKPRGARSATAIKRQVGVPRRRPTSTTGSVARRR